MKAPIKQAIILAGGRGERLRPHTDDRPKPMVQVGGFPLLFYTVNWLKQSGIERIVFSCGYRSSVISDYFADGASYGLETVYSCEAEPLGRGGGVQLASQQLRDREAPVLVANGDLLTDLSLPALFEHHRRGDKPVTLVTIPLKSPYGVIEIDEQGLATRFREKPQLPHWMNAGIYIVDGQVFDQFPQRGDHEEGLFPQMAQEHLLSAYKFEGFWTAIDTSKDLEELHKQHELLAQFKQRYNAGVV